MNAKLFFMRILGIRDRDYLQLLDDLRAGLNNHSIHFLHLEMLCKLRELPHWKMMNPVAHSDGEPLFEKLLEYVLAGYKPFHDLKDDIERARIWSKTPEGVAFYEEKEKQEKAALNAAHPPQKMIRLLKTATRQRSKLGGWPNLPASIQWPLNPDDIELDFLAQIHCPELPAGLGLPSVGTIFVFYDCEEMPWGLDEKDKQYWKIIYTEEPLPECPRKQTMQDPEYVEFPEAFITFSIAESHFTDAYEMTDAEPRTVHHQMLGYPLFIQDEDMAPGRILLLQLDTDEEDGGTCWMWGDCGRLFFWIKPEDLAACRFERVTLTLECG